MGEDNKEIHEHHHHHHDHGDEGTSYERLLALLKYMSGHNSDHTEELAHLALQVKEMGNTEAYNLTMEAVRFFEQGNGALKKALEHMEK